MSTLIPSVSESVIGMPVGNMEELTDTNNRYHAPTRWKRAQGVEILDSLRRSPRGFCFGAKTKSVDTAINVARDIMQTPGGNLHEVRHRLAGSPPALCAAAKLEHLTQASSGSTTRHSTTSPIVTAAS